MDAETTSPAQAPSPADDAAQLPADADAGQRETPAPRETTTDAPAGQQDDPVAKLTPEQRARILAEADPEDVARVNDRFNGYLGKKLQVTRAEEARQAEQRKLWDLRQKAVQANDPDAALEYTRASTEAESEQMHQAAWSEALGVYQALDADPLTKPIVSGLAGKDYGALAGGNGSFAALLYKADLAQGVIDHLPKWQEEMTARIRADLEKTLRPAIEREVKARLSGEEPAPDTGTGGAPSSPDLPRTLAAFRAFVDKLSPAEYSRREAEIDRHAAALTGRRAPSR